MRSDCDARATFTNISVNLTYQFAIIPYQTTHKFTGLASLLLQNLFFISVPVLCTVSSAIFYALFPATSIRNAVLTPNCASFPKKVCVEWCLSAKFGACPSLRSNTSVSHCSLFPVPSVSTCSGAIVSGSVLLLIIHQ